MKASEQDSNKGPLEEKKIMELGTGVECLEAKENITTRQQTLEQCSNLALASAFFAPGTKGPCPTVVRAAGIFSPG